MLTAYSRVTVVSAERKVDLALPSALPVSDVVPQVLRYCAPEDAATGQPTSWTLARLGGQPLALGQTLADAGVLDGEVLELREQHGDVQAAMVEDVRDAVEDSADAAGGAWTPRTTVTFVLLAGATAFVLLAVPVLTELRGVEPPFGFRLFSSHGPELVGCAAVALLLVGASGWAARVVPLWVAQLCAGVAMLWGLAIGLSIAAETQASAPVTRLLAVLGAAVVAAAAWVASRSATAHLAAGVTLAVFGGVPAVLSTMEIPGGQSERVLPVLAILLAGVVPRLSLSVGGLASADYRVRHVGQMDLAMLRARYVQSNALLVGALVGISVILVWGGIYLTWSSNPWDRYLSLSVAVAALLRSRVFSRTPHMLPLRVAGLVLLGLQLVRLTTGEGADLRPWLVLATVGLFAGAVAIGSLQMSEITRARVKRLLNIAEFLVVVDVVVLLLGATGVYSRLQEVGLT